MLVLLIEDDPDYAGIIAETARYDGHHVVIVGTDESARRFLSRETPDLVIADVILPDGSGFDVVAYMREASPQLPILMLSSMDSLPDIIRAFDAGVDDYVTKPFHPSELRARMRALMRRSAVAVPLIQEAPLEARPLEFDAPSGTFRYLGRDVGFTELETRILSEFIRVPDQVLTYAYLNQRVWKYSNLSDATLLKGHISSIRRKLRDAGCPGDPVRTISRVGYAFAPDGLERSQQGGADGEMEELCAS